MTTDTPNGIEEMSAKDLLKWGFDPDCGEHYPEKDAFKIMAKRLRTCQEERDRAVDDARRYQWLKANHLQTGEDSWIRTGDDLEEAIDAALKKGEG